MTVESIENLTELLSKYLKHGENIVESQYTKLTEPGENYSSIMLQVDIKLKNELTGENYILNTVGKLIPTNSMVNIFNFQVVFKNEIGFYRTIMPILQEFEGQYKAAHISNCVAKFIAGRISLDPKSSKADKNAVLILENLRAQGYQQIDRTKGFDFETAKLVITKMVTLHAVTLALKLKKPEVFEANIKPYLVDYFTDTKIISIEHQKEYMSNIINNKEIIQRVFAVIEKRSIKSFREPWATLIHNDLWIGNILVKNYNNEAVDVKFVDFQVSEYKSPTRDLIFFLFSSVKIEVLEQHLDDLLNLYYQQFIHALIELQVNTTPFSWNSFNEELKLAASQSEYYHVLWMLEVVHATKEYVKDVNEYTMGDFSNSRTQTKAHQDVIVYMTYEFAKRGWI